MNPNDGIKNEHVLKDKEKHEIVFMGGRITIAAGGNFKDEESGRNIEYGPKVNLFKVAEKGCKIHPSIFLTMLDAVKDDAKAMSILRDLSTKE